MIAQISQYEICWQINILLLLLLPLVLVKLYMRKYLTELPSENCQQVSKTPSEANTAKFHSQHILHTSSPTATNADDRSLII